MHGSHASHQLLLNGTTHSIPLAGTKQQHTLMKLVMVHFGIPRKPILVRMQLGCGLLASRHPSSSRSRVQKMRRKPHGWSG